MDRYSAKKLTKEKRKSQTCRVYEIKIDKSHLSTKSLNHLNSLFIETKWFYNYCLSQEDINNSDTKTKQVPVKVKDKFEERQLTVLTAQMKQSIKTRLFNSMSSLKSLKKNGYRIGRLKFKSKINSVPLKQIGNKKHSGTYYLNQDKSRIRIQGLKSWLKVRGLNQIAKDLEVANATLVRKSTGFYIHITTFKDKEQKDIPNQSIGIDFGCETQLTFSDGTKLEFQVPIPKRLKKLDRKINRKQSNGKKRSRSKKKYQDQHKRRKIYQRLTNKKTDIRNKVVNAITKNHKYVCFQDESIHAWHAGNHGKKIQHSGIGAILSDLKHKSDTPIEVNKFFPSTQLCPICNENTKHSVDKRVYVCQYCGFEDDRDIKSAKCIEQEGLEKFVAESNTIVPMDRREFKARERTSSVFFDRLSKINGIRVNKMFSMN